MQVIRFVNRARACSSRDGLVKVEEPTVSSERDLDASQNRGESLSETERQFMQMGEAHDRIRQEFLEGLPIKPAKYSGRSN